METGFLSVGNNTYVNPKYITRVEPSYEFENTSWVHTSDGKYVETAEGYTPEKIMDDLHNINYLA